MKATMKDLDDFSTTVMECDGYKAAIHKAARLKGEGIHGLPTGDMIKAYETSFFKNAPGNWLKEKGCYVVPVSKEWGLWFDWTLNDHANTAVVSSVKGMNPLTGQKMTGVALEDYIKKCPIHETPFQANLFCQDCGYSWPHHNYVSSPNTLWWDGFRQPDGTVRQFFFTDDEERDVASAMIGNENTVPAFGFAFYKTKKARSAWSSTSRDVFSGCSGSSDGVLGGDFYRQWQELNRAYENERGKKKYRGGIIWKVPDEIYGSGYGSGWLGNKGYDYNSNDHFLYMDHNTTTSANLAERKMGESQQLMCSVGSSNVSDNPKTKSFTNSTQPVKEVSIGAGAQINQGLAQDTGGIDAFETKPASLIRVYFCFQEHFNEIAAGGLSIPFERKRGFLANKVKVG